MKRLFILLLAGLLWLPAPTRAQDAKALGALVGVLKDVDEKLLLPLYVASNRLLVATQSASSSSSNDERFEKALNKISSLVESAMNEYVRIEREKLSHDITQLVSKFRLQDEIPKFRGTSALKGHNRVVVATQLGEKVKTRLESSLEIVSDCGETEIRSAILHECVSVAETYVTRLFARIRAPIFNGSYVVFECNVRASLSHVMMSIAST